MQKMIFFVVFFVVFHINESFAKPCQRYDPHCLPEPCGGLDYCPWSRFYNDYRSTIVRAMMPKNQENDLSIVKVGLISKSKKKRKKSNVILCTDISTFTYSWIKKFSFIG